jgi:glycosidase
VADPYSEKILDPWNDRFISPVTYPGIKPYPSDFTQDIVGILQTASPRYSWTTTGYQRPDKRKLIIYELLLRDFIASHDWNTLADTLEYLKKTGINAIQLMPFNEFEGNISWGYNPSFYFAPDKYYGKANDLKRFIDICHASGMAVVMDIALNHSFGLSPMVRMYWDEANNRPAANNPWFNKTARHGFNVGYDFNHESDATKYFVERVLRHWLTQYRIDGFRFDLSKGFTQRQTCDSTGNNCNISAWGAYDQSRINILNRYYDSMQSFLPGSYAILEHFADNSEETVLSNRGFLLWGNMNYNYSQASMGLANGADISYGLHTARGWNDPHLVTYMESHDEERVNYRNITAGNVSGAYNIRDSLTACKRMELSHVFLLTLPGPKMIWQFGELGYDYPINYCENGTVNNNCRTDPKPIRWNYLPDQKRNSIYDLVGHINRLRNHDDFSDLFVTGNVSSGLTGLQKWIKLWDPSGPGILAVGNFDLVARDLSASFPSAGVWYDYLNAPDSIIASGGNRTFSLQPGEYKIFINRFIPLPGTIISFTGTNSGFINLLRWNVLEEQEVAGYELQRSIDSLNFTRVALLNKNNSGNYSYDDDIAILSSGIFFYRVKLIFNDGSFKYSKVIRLTLPAPPPADQFSVKLSPNPFSGSPALDISSPAAGQVAVMIFDMAGRLMAKGNYSVARGDNRLFIREATGFAGGAYLIKVVEGDIIKLIKAN